MVNSDGLMVRRVRLLVVSYKLRSLLTNNREPKEIVLDFVPNTIKR